MGCHFWCQVATCFKAPGVSLGGSGVSIEGVRILRADFFLTHSIHVYGIFTIIYLLIMLDVSW